jgi:hypothetical protein
MRILRNAVLVSLAIVAGSSLLGGCAKFYWTKPGSTPEQFSAASAQCVKEATVVPAAATSIEIQTYRQCLEKQGYVRQELYVPSADSHRGVEHWRDINLNNSR